MSLWVNTVHLKSKQFKCGYCGQFIASEKGWQSNSLPQHIYICHHCYKPTFFDGNIQSPGVILGGDVADINDVEVEKLYQEARVCSSYNAFTATVLCCRKLLMHIAVAKGAETGKSFFEYVEFFANQNYIPPDAKEWVHHIRMKGNEANHEIKIMESEDAKDLLTFLEMLLKLVYEFPASIKRKNST